MSDRRQFITGAGLAAFTGLGAIGALYAAKRSWDPLPSVAASGFTIVDLSVAKENQLVVEKWRGKPIFILKKSVDMKKDKRDIVVNGENFHISIGLCTHLGCIPSYRPEKKNFLCACHGGEFDASGNVTKAPPPSPLVIPPFKLDGTKLVLGEEGSEYKKLKDADLIA
ncbi:MAG: Rieske 2Fe-2S domain-containing protein [Sulfurovum sp.]|nr:Rieske 2Fe-2S domain-containing protein [Sulfurovum sp.]